MSQVDHIDDADPLSDPDLRATDGSLDVEVLVVGAGISGICTGIQLLRRGYSSFMLLEAGTELGGTWRDNTYPGVAVDIPSISYCFSFETDYPWSRKFAPGHEILAYLKHCVERYSIARHIRYDSRVLRTSFDQSRDRWSTQLVSGVVVTSRHVVSATGLFGEPIIPDIPGLETFAGTSMHSARWDHGYDLTAKRVAVIGTGASSVQIVPEIAPQVSHLSVFQRTPIWVGPRLDRPLNSSSALAPRRFTPVRSILRFLSELGLEALSFAIVNYQRLPFLVGIIQKGVRAIMRRQLGSAQLITKLVPDYVPGCKRPAISDRYLSTYNRDNVSLITDGIERICPQGIITVGGELHTFDMLVLATGFLTTEQGNGPSFEVFGSEGAELGQYWEEHRLQAYAGVSMPGFPNFFLTAGPYSGGFNWFTMVEANVDHIMQCIDGARARAVTRVEVKWKAHHRYMRHMWRRAQGTVFKNGACRSANSYYLDRHSDASLPLPHTPWWRVVRARVTKLRDYRFGSNPDG
jgi:cyclohexanone monooxygenase